MPKLKNLFVSETCLRFCAIDSQMRFFALAIASKKIQNRKWNSRKVVAIWCSQWNSGLAVKSLCLSHSRVITPLWNFYMILTQDLGGERRVKPPLLPLWRWLKFISNTLSKSRTSCANNPIRDIFLLKWEL